MKRLEKFKKVHPRFYEVFCEYAAHMDRLYKDNEKAVEKHDKLFRHGGISRKRREVKKITALLEPGKWIESRAIKINNVIKKLDEDIEG